MKNSNIHTQGIRLGVQLLLGCILAGVIAWSLDIGPDSFGYIATDNTPYSFVDVSSTGAAVLAGTDDGTAVVNVGFPFTFYGKSYSSACVSSNGLLSLGGCNPLDFANQDFTASSPAGDYPTIAPLWNDLTFNAQGAGAVYYQTIGQTGNRRFVVQWQNAYLLNGSKGITFQAILQEGDAKIIFQYLDVTTGAGSPANLGGSATVGIRDTGGQTNGRCLQWSYKVPVLSNAKAILFMPQQVVQGDVNGDGKVDCADLAIIKAAFGKKCGQAGFDPRADVNKDCVVDIRDLSWVSQKVPAGTKCP